MTLISPEYLEQQRQMHAAPRGYGGGGHKHAIKVASLAGRHRCRTILDYGCGQATLSRALREAGEGFDVLDYDPAIDGKRVVRVSDMVVCTDVLEHVEPELLDNVLLDLGSLVRKVLYCVIATRPANKTLPDGRNAHLTVQSADWWDEKITTVRLSGSRLAYYSCDRLEGEVRMVLVR